jgi:hypothetical protein
MSFVKHATDNLWKHVKKHEIYYKVNKDDLKGFKDARARTRAENKGWRIHQNKSHVRDNSINGPTSVIEKAFLEFIVGTRPLFQAVESQQLRTFLKLLKAPDVVCILPAKALTRKIRDMAVSQKEVLIKDLTEALGYCLSFDLWTSPSGLQYIYLIHYSNEDFV